MNVILIVETFVAFIIALSLHEAAHAGMATILGDSTPAGDGRLSLAPTRHMAAIGTIVAIVSCVSTFPGGLGWGRPVDIDARRMRGGPNTGLLLVALAGPTMNAIIGTGLALGLHAIPGFGALSSRAIQCSGTSGFGVSLQKCLSTAQSPYLIRVEQFLIVLAVTNILIALVNIIPLHPLDGYRVLYAILPTRQALAFRNYEQYMEFMLLVLFFVVPYLFAIVGLGASPTTWLGLLTNPGQWLIVHANMLASRAIGPVAGIYVLL